MDKILIGGKDREIQLKYKDFEKFSAKYQLLFEESKAAVNQGKTYNWNIFIFWTVWKSLKKSGIWPFRKPFRSMSHMIKSLLFDEYKSVTSWTSGKILGTVSEDKETKNGKMMNS